LPAQPHRLIQKLRCRVDLFLAEQAIGLEQTGCKFAIGASSRISSLVSSKLKRMSSACTMRILPATRNRVNRGGGGLRLVTIMVIPSGSRSIPLEITPLKSDWESAS
jgi:hypothetical protein